MVTACSHLVPAAIAPVTEPMRIRDRFLAIVARVDAVFRKKEIKRHGLRVALFQEIFENIPPIPPRPGPAALVALCGVNSIERSLIYGDDDDIAGLVAFDGPPAVGGVV